jgi:hypothetical protein
MSTSRVPIFLLGGINKWNNFLGVRTLQTGLYGAICTGARLSPVWFIYKYADARGKVPRVAEQ